MDNIIEVIVATAIILVSLYVWWGLIIIKQNQSAVIERLGKFHRVLDAGVHILCLPGVIDKVTKSPNGHDRVPVLQRIAIPVFGDGELVDFKDDSAGVKAELWITVGNQELDLKKDWDQIAEAVRKYVYAAEDSKARTQKIVGEALRPELQKLTIDEALEKKAEIGATMESAETKQSLNTALNEMGLWLTLEKGITINDIVLTDKAIEFRRRVLEAKRDAQVREARAKGTRKALETIAKGENGAGDGGTIDIRDAADIERSLQGIEALGKVDSVSIVGSSVEAMVNSLIKTEKNTRRN